MLKNQFSFCDGIAKIYKTENIAESGNAPVEGLILKGTVRFEYRTVGYNRFFTALQNQVQISKMILIPMGICVTPQDIVILSNDTKQYVIAQIQDKTDTAPYTKLLSLKRIEAMYDIKAI